MSGPPVRIQRILLLVQLPKDMPELQMKERVARLKNQRILKRKLRRIKTPLVIEDLRQQSHSGNVSLLEPHRFQRL